MCYSSHNKTCLHFIQLIFDYITEVANFVRKFRLKKLKKKWKRIKLVLFLSKNISSKLILLIISMLNIISII